MPNAVSHLSILSIFGRLPKLEKFGIGIENSRSPSTDRRIGPKVGRSELPGRSKVKSTNSPLKIWSSSFLGRLAVSSDAETFDAGDGACCVDIKAATCEGLPRSNDCVGTVCAGKSSASGGGFDADCDELFSRARTSRSNGARSDASERRDSAEKCEVGVVFVGVVLVGVTSEGAGAAEFSALSCSARRRKMVARDPARDRFRCANRRCRTSVDKSA